MLTVSSGSNGRRHALPFPDPLLRSRECKMHALFEHPDRRFLNVDRQEGLLKKSELASGHLLEIIFIQTPCRQRRSSVCCLMFKWIFMETIAFKIHATDNLPCASLPWRPAARHGRDRSDLTRGAGRPTRSMLTRSMLLTWRIVPQWPAHRSHPDIRSDVPRADAHASLLVEDGWMGDCVLVRCDPAQSVSLRLFRELSPIFGDGLMDQAAAWA